MTPTLIQIPTLNDAPRDFCVLNKRAEENERLTICKQLKWFWFYPQIYADFLPQDGRDERLLVRGQADACPSRCCARRIIGWRASVPASRLPRCARRESGAATRAQRGPCHRTPDPGRKIWSAAASGIPRDAAFSAFDVQRWAFGVHKTAAWNAARTGRRLSLTALREPVHRAGGAAGDNARRYRPDSRAGGNGAR